MIRHPKNTNLTFLHQSMFQGLPVYTDRGPLVLEYLGRSKEVIDRARKDYARVFAFRFDLRFPAGHCASYFDDNRVLDRFFASFKDKIRHNRNRARESNRNAHDSVVRYIWCREIGQHGIPHYHVVVLLNNDAFCTLGRYELGGDNIFNRLHEAWASALGRSVEGVVGLVEFPKNPFYLLTRDDPATMADFFFRVSYLCKADTKCYGDWVHTFGTSRS